MEFEFRRCCAGVPQGIQGCAAQRQACTVRGCENRIGAVLTAVRRGSIAQLAKSLDEKRDRVRLVTAAQDWSRLSEQFAAFALPSRNYGAFGFTL